MMGILDIVLIGMTIINCVLSFVAVYLVHQAVKKRQEAEENKIARENSHVELTSSTVSEIILAAESMPEDESLQVIVVPGTRIIQKTKTELQVITKTGIA